MKKSKERAERIIYDDHFSLTAYDYARESLYSNEYYMSERGYQEPEEIPESDIYEEMEFLNLIAWENSVKPELEKFLEDSFGCVAFGTIGRWNGRYPYGHIINSVDDFMLLVNGCDNVKVYDTDGHFLIHVTHHDSYHEFEMKCLNAKGRDYVDKNEINIASIQRLWLNYTILPNFANKVYGIPKRQNSGR